MFNYITHLYTVKFLSVITLIPCTFSYKFSTDQTMQYVRSLEQRVKQLEEDKSMLQARAQGREIPSGEVRENPTSPNSNSHLGSRPEAVVRALQVLEVREQLEREEGHDGEKALVREMCNVSIYYCHFSIYIEFSFDMVVPFSS